MPPIPITLLLLLLYTATIQVTGSDDVLCFSKVNEMTGECEESDYLGDGVSENDCCLNIKYAFKRDQHSPCEGCRPAEWSPWSEWSGCTVSCLEGVQDRQRICIGQGDCNGDNVEVRSCTLQDCCPEKGGWSEWSPWSQCSVTCLVGQRRRTRECNNPPPSCNGECIGPPIEVERCDTKQICPTHGSWGNWGPWNQCSSSCTIEGSGIFPVQNRFRECNNPPPSTNPPGNPCEGSRQDTQECRGVPFCEVDGQWGSWQADSECSVTCGVGRIRQKRICDNPAPRHRGKDCVGPSIKHIICNTNKPCPIDGKWSAWGEWSRCGRVEGDIIRCKQKVGHQNRQRTCEGQNYDGEWCDGDYQERRRCYDIEKCSVSGSWTEWSAWGLCSSPCGEAEKKRYRECAPIYPAYPNIVEGASGKVSEVFFSGNPRPKCEPINKETLKIEETTECKNLPKCPP